MTKENEDRLIDYLYPDLFPYGKKEEIIEWSEGVMTRAIQFIVDENRKILDRLERLQPKCWFEGEELKCDWICEEEESD